MLNIVANILIIYILTSTTKKKKQKKRMNEKIHLIKIKNRKTEIAPG